jgi:hypothetical protein
MKKKLFIILPLILLLGFFITLGNANANNSCNEAEWNNISQKYRLSELLSREQDIINQMGAIATDASDLSKSVDYTTFSSLQIQRDSLKRQYDQALTLAERECDAIGADRAAQLNEK